ncbi:MAG: hypothetical protein AAF573_15770, partial [Bacteroidota bacterium]
LRKRSFNKKVLQTIELEIHSEGSQTFTFSQNQWNQNYPFFEIFDVLFINENIYTGLEIERTHKKKLFEIILGEEGVRLKNEIAILKDRIRNGNKIIRETARGIEQEIDNVFTALEYAEIQPSEDIEDQLKFKAQELETAKNFQVIQAQPTLKEIPLVRLPFDVEKAKAVLVQSVDDISQAYLEKFKAHKESLNMGGKSEEWIQMGYENIHDDKCPFCLQPLHDELEIIQAYQQYFNQTYNQLLTDLAGLNKKLNAYNLEVQILDIENRITQHLALIDFWKKYLPHAPEPISILDQKKDLLSSWEGVASTFAHKMADPITSQSASSLDIFNEKIDYVNELLDFYNKKITDYNENIFLVKDADQSNPRQIELEQKKLMAIQKRATPSTENACKKLKTYTSAVGQLKKEMKDKQRQLDIFKGTVFLEYLNKINQHLKDFAPYLKIKNLSSAYQGSSTEPVVKFALMMSDNELLQKEHDTKPTVKYGMSEGDKSALALAFFFTKLEMDKQLDQKIIVVDDAISSLDANRKGILIRKLLAYGQKAKQLFLLSHDKFLVARLWKKSKEQNLACQTYRIGVDQDRESSVLLPLEIPA